MSMEPDVTSPRRITRAGEYDLIRRMGSGGFGVVFEARHRQTGLLYAVKRIELSDEDAERYRNEALYPARIASDSAHVLGVHSFFHDPAADVFYLVTELIPHGDLRTFLVQQPKPLPLPLAMQVGAGIAKGLAAIHAQGIVHRDLKPANVLMDRKDGQWVPKIADFGLARSTRSVSLGEFASSGYAAPEQLDLLSDLPLGPEADLFSFGMVLYELLTGESASRATDLREYGRWLAARRLPPSPSAVRPELAQWPAVERLVASLLVFDRAQRTTTALACAQVLQNALRTVDRTVVQPALRLPTPPPQPTPPPAPPPIAPVPPAAQEPVPPLPERQSLVQTPPLERRQTGPTTPRSKAPFVGAVLAAAAVAVLVVGVAGWWGYRRFTVWDAARRGQAAYDHGRYKDAFPLLLTASDAGDAKSAAYLGLMYLNGEGVTQNYPEGRRWFDRAATKNDQTGHAGLGWMALRGFGVPKDEAEGVRELRRAADGGDRTAMAWLGWAFETGAGVEPDPREALRHYRQAADAGSQVGRYAVGRFYRDGLGGVDKSPDEAIAWFTRGATTGYPESQCALGDVHLARFHEARRAAKPTMVPSVLAAHPTARESLRWFQMAADAGRSCGEISVGYMYWFGYGVRASYDDALKWNELAAGHGHETAKTNVTTMRTGWDSPPLFVGSWQQVAGADRRQEVARLLDDGTLAAAGAQDPRRMRRTNLDFYDGAVLYEVEVARGDGSRGVLTYVRHRGRVIRIDGKAAPIRDLNTSAPIRLDTSQRAAAFLRFYMAAYQGSDGIIRLVDNGTQLTWLTTATDYQKSSTGLLVVPLTVSPHAAGGWESTARAQYGTNAHRLTVWVKPDGSVEVLQQERVASSLAVTQERFDDKGLRVRVGKSAS